MKRRGTTQVDPVESIYGLTNVSVGAPPKGKPNSPKKKPARKVRPKLSVKKDKTVPPKRSFVVSDESVTYVPDFKIRYDTLELPDIATGLELHNAVALSDNMLKFVKNRTELRTKHLSTLILESVVPSLLACDAGLAYTKTFLEAGFGFETKPDDTIADSLSDLVRFEVLTFFIRRSRLPRTSKRQLLSALTEKFAEQMVVSMKDALKKSKVEDRVKDLEAFVVRTMSDKKVSGLRRPPADGQQPTGPIRGAVKRRGM